MKRIALALAATALVASPLAANAQTQSSTVNLSGEVLKACVLGAPTLANLSLGDLTGDDGRLSSVMTGPAVIATAEIPVAWCNTPSRMTIDASPMAMLNPPAYAPSAAFSRLITYDAKVIGWVGNLADRPLVGDQPKVADAAGAHAAAPLLGIQISRLATLDLGGTNENEAFLEAGTYRGSIIIGVSVYP